MKTNGLRQIAKKAGCSCAMVSRVLNNRHGISEAVRKKILALAGEMKYAGRCFFQRVFLIPCSQNRSSGCILQNYHSGLT